MYGKGMMDPSRESGLGSDTDNMSELAALLNTEIPEGQSNLMDSFTNLERVADYCEGNYFQAENKRYALEETKNYTTQSLASVAYQINTLAYNFLQLLDLQSSQLDEMEAQMNHIAQTVMIHKEKVARREIGVLTANKTTNRQYKIIAPANPEKPIKYVRKPIDFSALDQIGQGGGAGGGGGGWLKVRTTSQTTVVGPPPTTKPPTPPSALRSATGSLGKSSREYRTPPAVAPPQTVGLAFSVVVLGLGESASESVPERTSEGNEQNLTDPPSVLFGQTSGKGDILDSEGLSGQGDPGSMRQVSVSYTWQVPSHYAPNYPVGHPRRTGAGYSTLPLAHIQQQVNPPPPPATPAATSSYLSDHHMPPPPSPLTLSQQQHVEARSSPPLPPPPSAHHEFQHNFVTPLPILSDELDLPGWVPKNYIEKVVAIYDYYADKEDELSFQESAVIYVLKKNDDGWWEGVMDGITGLFPGNYVEPCV